MNNLITKFNHYINEAYSFNEAIEISFDELKNMIEENDFELVDTDYTGNPEEQINIAKNQFEDNQVVLLLFPPEGSNIIEENGNIMYLITNTKIYKVDNVSEKQYNELYNMLN